MSKQASPAIAPVCTELPALITLSSTFTPSIKTKHSILVFFRLLNPFNWFGGFTNIDISLEEFAIKKINENKD